MRWNMTNSCYRCALNTSPRLIRPWYLSQTLTPLNTEASSTSATWSKSRLAVRWKKLRKSWSSSYSRRNGVTLDMLQIFINLKPTRSRRRSLRTSKIGYVTLSVRVSISRQALWFPSFLPSRKIAPSSITFFKVCRGRASAVIHLMLVTKPARRSVSMSDSMRRNWILHRVLAISVWLVSLWVKWVATMKNACSRI